MQNIGLLPIVLAALASSAFGQDTSLQRCRVLPDTTARLACYDALADAARVPVPPARPATPATTAATASPAPMAATAKTAAATTAATATAPARTGEAAFGLPETRQPDRVEAVESTLSPSFSGWGPNSRIKLANGQVWQVIDGTSVALPEGARKVAVKRGALGSFYLDIEGLKTSPRVRRVE